MDQMDDALMTLFVEDTRERLGDIESALMDMERAGAGIDGELVNKVFRAAHSIKGGAGFLNLRNIRDLAHRLESLLHLVRNREMAPDARVVNLLLAGFDRLLALVESVAASDRQDIGQTLADLAGLTDEHLTSEQKAQAAAVIPVALPGGEVVFSEDELSLRQAVSGGRNLYLVEYDLIHDVQARGRTPFDVISTMEASGLIVGCRMELAAVGDLGDPPVNRIPFYVLFASVVEPDIVGYLFALDVGRIHPVVLPEPAAAALAGPKGPEGADAAFGPWRLRFAASGAVLSLDAGAAPDAAAAREALLAALSRGDGLVIDWNAAQAVDLAAVQVVVAAARAFAARGLAFGHAGGPPRALADVAARAGIDPEALAAVGLPADVLFAS